MTTELSDAKSKLKEKETKIKCPLIEFELFFDILMVTEFHFPLLRDLCKGNLVVMNLCKYTVVN